MLGLRLRSATYLGVRTKTMTRNGILIVVTTLIIISALPQYISMYNFINNGSVAWPMQWNNEQRLWALIFSLLTLPALFLSLGTKEINTKLRAIFLLLSSVIISIALFNIVTSGIGQSSKADSESLLLVEFWRSGWWL